MTDIYISSYKKSLIVYGNTKPWKDYLASSGGKYNGSLNYDNIEKPEIPKTDAHLTGWLFFNAQAKKGVPIYDKLIEWRKTLQSSLKHEIKTIEKEKEKKHSPSSPPIINLIERDNDNDDKYHTIKLKVDEKHNVALGKNTIVISPDVPLVIDQKNKKTSTFPTIISPSPQPIVKLVDPVNVFDNPNLIPDAYLNFTSDEYKFWTQQHFNSLGWLYYLQDKYPDLCLLHSDYNSILFHYFNTSPSNENIRESYNVRKIIDFSPEHQPIKRIILKKFEKQLWGDYDTWELVDQEFLAPEGYEFIPSLAYTINIKGKMFVNSDILELFKECIEVKKKRFSACILIIWPEHFKSGGIAEGRHANALVYDAETKNLYRFEPHGAVGYNESNPEDIRYREVGYDSKRLDDYLLSAIEKSGLSKYVKKYIPPIDFCPYIGPQHKEATYIKKKYELGYCVAWSLFFIQSVLENKKLTPKQIVDKITKKSGKDVLILIRAYASYLKLKQASLPKLKELR